MTQQLPTYEDLYAFLKAHYKHDRFAGRDESKWDGVKYSDIVTKSRMEDLAKSGRDLISRYESATGEPVWFDATLTIIPSPY